MPHPNPCKQRGFIEPRSSIILAASCLAALVFLPSPMPGADLTPVTEKSFERYMALTEARFQQDFQPSRFLWLDGRPDDRARVRQGEKLIVARTTLDGGKPVKVPDGLIQDWLGA